MDPIESTGLNPGESVPLSSSAILSGVTAAAIPYIEQYFGLWLMRDVEFAHLCGLMQSFDVVAHLAGPAPQRARDAADRYGYELRDGIAVIQLRGTMMKHESSFGSGASTVLTREVIKNAAANPDVKGAMLLIESPGGTAVGTQELAHEWAKFGATKPTATFFEDMGASAAYWVGSQSRSVYANEAARIGSIGVYGVAVDSSQRYAAEGIKVHLVRAGEYKGMGTPGIPISESQIAEMQRHIDATNEFFVEGVAAGRKMDPAIVAKLADGRVHVAKQAKALGLIDHVATFEDAMEQFRASVSAAISRPGFSVKPGNTNLKGSNMTTEPIAAEPTAATIDELESVCAGAPATFIMEQLKAKATKEVASAAWMKQLSEQNASLQTALDKTKAIPPAAPPKVGHQPVEVAGMDVEINAGSTQKWKERVQHYRAQGLSQEQAMSRVDADFPGLRESMLQEFNATHKPRPFNGRAKQ